MSVDDFEEAALSGALSRTFANPKSSTLTFSSGPILYIGGLQVAMHDSFFVRGFQRFADLLRNGASFIDGQWRTKKESCIAT